MTGELPETSGYGRTMIAVNAVVSVVVAYLLVWWAAGFEVFHENLFRVQPTVDGGGVGTDFVVGNADPMLNALIAIIHFVDVLMGVFILLMVFIHWGAFRRIAAQMRQPGEELATDGGEEQ